MEAIGLRACAEKGQRLPLCVGSLPRPMKPIVTHLPSPFISPSINRESGRASTGILRSQTLISSMALLKYFSRALPTAEQTGIGKVATREANKAVTEELHHSEANQTKLQRKKKAYSVFSGEQCAAIGKYAAEHSNAAAVKTFKGDFDGQLGENTVQLFKRKYYGELSKAKASKPQEVVEGKSIPNKKRRRPLTLEDIDREVQAHIKALRKAGTPVSIQVVLAAAEGIVMAKDRTLLRSNGGTIELKHSWGVSLLSRMGYVKSRGSTSAKSKLSDQAIKHLKHSYLAQIKGVVEVHKIPQELIINWDQTGIQLALTSNWTMEECGAERVEIADLGDKRQVTATLACTLVGDLLPIQVIYTGTMERCYPTFTYPSGFDVWHSPNQETSLCFIEKIIMPFIDDVCRKLGTPEQKALVIFDVSRGQTGERVQALLESNIIRVLAPGNCTDILQLT